MNWRRDIQLLEKWSRNPSSLAILQMDSGTCNLTWLIMTEHYLICIQFDPNHTFEKEVLLLKRLKSCTTSNVSNPLQYSMYYPIEDHHESLFFPTKIYIECHPGRVIICFALGNISSEPKLISRELPESNLSARFSATIHFHPNLALLSSSCWLVWFVRIWF